MRLVRSAQSDEDLVAIWRYIAKSNPTAATRILERIDARIQSLARNPYLGETQPQYSERTRRIIVGNYIVYYDVLPDTVHVLRIFHAARALDRLFD